MSSTDGRPVALVTGASRGIGRATASLLVERGYRVIGTARAPDRLPASERLPGVSYLPLDLESDESIRCCVEAAGPLDVLINNAGRSQIGALEHVGVEPVRRLFAVNVFGPITVTSLCLPAMRERGGGFVIVIGSLMAEFPVPFQSTYAATKLALQGFVLSLRTEVEPFGIRVALVQPGHVRTGIRGETERILPERSPYSPAMDEVNERAQVAVERAGDPHPVAEKVLRVISTRRPAPVYSVGAEAALFTFAKRFVPRRHVERLVARRYGL